LFITILGVDHMLQETDSSGDFRKLIESIIEESPVDVVAEEAKLNYQTIPRQIAKARAIRWLGVDTSPEDKTRLGIHDELMNRPKDLIFGDTTCLGEKGKYLANADNIREQLWVSRTLESGARTALFICGVLHLQQLAEKFSAAGCEVTQLNVCELGWYKQNYGEIKLVTGKDGSLWYEARYVNPKSIF
jgi:hypothetical protein